MFSPIQLEGGLTIFSVCKICNKKLSDNVDKPFLNDTRIGIYRQVLQLKRSDSNRGIANPLIGAKINGSDDENYYITFKDGQPQLNRRPTTKIVEDKNSQRVIITANPDKLEERLDDFLNKRGFDKSKITDIKESITPITKAVSFTTTPKFIMYEGVKIAYEFTASILPMYLEDKWSKEYSNFLESGLLSKFIEEQLDNSEYIMNVSKNVYELLTKLPHHIHAVYAKSYEDFGLVCIVKIFNFITFHKMSEQCLLDYNADVFLTLDPLSRIVYSEK